MTTASTSLSPRAWNRIRLARALATVADVLSIEGASQHRIHAIRRAVDGILAFPEPMTSIYSHPEQVPGVGKEIAGWIRTLLDSSLEELLRSLGVTLPPSAAQLIRLPGVGPKTAYALVRQHNIASIADLSLALASGHLGKIPGFGTNRLARLRRDVRVLEERLLFTPVAIAAPLSRQLETAVSHLSGVIRVSVTGDLRRFVAMMKQIHLLAAVTSEDSLTEWANQWDANTVPGGYQFVLETMNDQIPVFIETTTNEAFPQRLMETTGDETHQGVLVGLLGNVGILWTEDGLVRVETNERVPVKTEEDIYRLVGLPWLPPEIREDRGILQNPAQLVKRQEIRGDLHVHSDWSDGDLSILEIATAAEALGYEYVAITDHSQSLTIANGLTPERLRLRRQEIDEVSRRTKVKLLDGIEVDILPDGRLDLPDEVLAERDVVIASVHSSMQQSKHQMTERILRAIRHPAVHIIGHMTGRIIGRRAGYELDVDRIIGEAANHGVMIELNSNPNRLDISENLLRKVSAAGILVPINTDTHHSHEFDYVEYGIRMARRGWLRTPDVLNTRSFKELAALLQRTD